MHNNINIFKSILFWKNLKFEYIYLSQIFRLIKYYIFESFGCQCQSFEIVLPNLEYPWSSSRPTIAIRILSIIKLNKILYFILSHLVLVYLVNLRLILFYSNGSYTNPHSRSRYIPSLWYRVKTISVPDPRVESRSFWGSFRYQQMVKWWWSLFHFKSVVFI